MNSRTGLDLVHRSYVSCRKVRGNLPMYFLFQRYQIIPLDDGRTNGSTTMTIIPYDFPQEHAKHQP